MSEEKLYLRENIAAEPLVDQWYAWSHLISPATAAMNLVGRHLRIMESYIDAPQVHMAAVKNPALLGGPFIDYPENRAAEIEQLIQKTRIERTDMLQFAEAVAELDRMLNAEAKGMSLEPLYAKVPGPLRGFVELVYDLNHNPSFRLIEPLLYRSCYYKPEAQSLILSEIGQDDRPFVLSTPRMLEEKDVPLAVPFDHPGLDDLFAMKRTPLSFNTIKDKLGWDDQYDEKIRSFFTTQPPKEYDEYKGSGARWRYFGHACILLETKGASILIDPVLSYTYESDISRYTYSDLPDSIDYVLITHNHQDHILFETLLQIRHRVRHIIVPRNGAGALQDPSLKLMLHRIGFTNVIEIDEMETVSFSGGQITGLPFLGEHADLNIRTKLAYHVRLGNWTFLFAADSCNLEPAIYTRVYQSIGNIDALFLGMECDGAPLSWLYGPLVTAPLPRAIDQSRRLAGSNYDRGMALVDQFHFKAVYVYAMGQEPWLNYIMSKKYSDDSNPIIASNQLLNCCKERGILSERLFGEREIFLD